MSLLLDRFGYRLTLQVDADHTYTVQSPRADIGLFTIEAMELAERISLLDEDSDTERVQALSDQMVKLEANAPADVLDNPHKALLGDVYDQLIADGMPLSVLQAIEATVTVWVKTDAESAMRFWDQLGSEGPTRAVPQDRKKKKKTSSSHATSK